MKCDGCSKEVYRVRIVDGKQICKICMPDGLPEGLFRLSGNPYKTDETEAYKRDLESRYVPPGQTQWERWRRGAKTFI